MTKRPPVRYPRIDSIEAHYVYAAQINDGHVGPHLPRLKALATGLALCVEFGVRRGGSSSALLLGAAHVISYDVEPTPEAKRLAEVAGDRWAYHIASSLDVEIPRCELLFIDSKHTYRQCAAELTKHASHATRYLVFHDSIWRGSMGEGTSDMKLTRDPDPATRTKAMGIRPAIDELMMRDPTWFLAAHYTDSCGLLVLERPHVS